MNTVERHRWILEEIKRKGYVSVSEVSKFLNVSEVTVRKDLRLLEEKGLLFRNHGGAGGVDPYVLDKPISHKQNINKKEKDRIGKRSVDFLENNDVVFLGSGTTILDFAKNIPKTIPLTVVTSSLLVSSHLCEYEMVNVIQLGGDVRRSSRSTVGALAEQVVRSISANKLFLGTDGVDCKFGISTSNLAEANLNKLMIESSNKVFILSDHSKFGKKGLGKICDFDDIDYLVTDKEVEGVLKKELNKKSVKVILS